MYTLASSTTVSASVSEVWGVLSDVDRWSTWDPHEESSHLNGAFAIGTTIESKPHGGPAATSVIEQLEPGTSWTASCALPGGRLRGTTTLTSDAGDTQITRSMTATGPFSIVFRLWFGPRILADWGKSFAALPAEVERRRG